MLSPWALREESVPLNFLIGFVGAIFSSQYVDVLQFFGDILFRLFVAFVNKSKRGAICELLV